MVADSNDTVDLDEDTENVIDEVWSNANSVWFYILLHMLYLYYM